MQPEAEAQGFSLGGRGVVRVERVVEFVVRAVVVCAVFVRAIIVGSRGVPRVVGSRGVWLVVGLLIAGSVGWAGPAGLCWSVWSAWSWWWGPLVASGKLGRQIDDTLVIAAGPFDGPGRVGLVRRGEPCGPAAMGLEPVVKPAQGHQVTSAGCATSGIGDHMIKIAILGLSSAAGVSTDLMQGDDLVDQGLGWLVATMLVAASSVISGPVAAHRPQSAALIAAVKGSIATATCPISAAAGRMVAVTAKAVATGFGFGMGIGVGVGTAGVGGGLGIGRPTWFWRFGDPR
jgi:hypothetical protein